MEKLPLYILSFILMTNCLYAKEFDPGLEPDGFRGIKWKQEISTLSDMKRVETRQVCVKRGCGPIEIYLRKDDVMKIGDANLDRIEYRFCSGKFYGAFIMLSGKEDYEAIKKYLFTKYGPDKINSFSYYVWFGNKSRVELHGGPKKAELSIWANTLFHWHCFGEPVDFKKLLGE